MAVNKASLNEDSTAIVLQSEINAKIPYNMGLNARKHMQQDKFLMHFIPSIDRQSMETAISPEMLAKFGIHDIKTVDDPEGIFKRIMYEDTRLLGAVAEASFASKYEDWKEEVQVINDVKIMAKAAIDIMKQCLNKNMDPENSTMNNEKKQIICKEIATLNNDIKTITDKIDQAYKKSMTDKDLTSEDKIILNNKIQVYRRNCWEYTVSKHSRQAQLVAEGCFDFMKNNVAEDQLTTAQKEQISNMTKEKYTSLFQSKCFAKIEQLKERYKEKYDATPKYLASFEKILNEMPRYLNNVDLIMSDIDRTFQQGIEHYADILTDGPNIIMQITKMFPELVATHDREMAIYRAGRAESLAASLHYDDSNKFKAKERFTFKMSNIMGKDNMAVVDDPNRLVMAIYGPPGIGKTASVSSFMKKIGHNCLQLAMPALDSTYFTGAPVINVHNQMVHVPSSDMQNCIDFPTLIAIDEATAAIDDGLIQQMARFLQFGELNNEIRVHPLCTMILMANDDPQHNPLIKALPGHVQTRVESFYMNKAWPLMAGWANWVLNEPNIQEDKELKMAYDTILSFLLNTPEGENYIIQKGANETKNISPNFRVWTRAADDIGAVINQPGLSVNDITRELRLATENIVGMKAASHLAQHFKLTAELPTIKQLIARMDPEGQPALTLKDAVRIYDMNNSQIIDTSKSREDGTSQNDTTKGKKSNGRFKLMVDNDDDKQLIEKINIMEKDNFKNSKNGRVYLVSDLMPADKLEKRFNEIWGDPNTEITGTSVLFHFASQILYDMKGLYKTADTNHVPVNGNKLDDLFKLAMTIPGKDYRQSIIIQMMNFVINDASTMTHYKYGIEYNNEKNQKAVFKISPPDFKGPDGNIIKTDIKKLIEENKDPSVQYFPTTHVILPRRLLMNVSEAYQANVGEATKRTKKKTKEETDEPEI